MYLQYSCRQAQFYVFDFYVSMCKIHGTVLKLTKKIAKAHTLFLINFANSRGKNMRVLNRQFAERLADLLDKHQVSNVKLARYLDVTGSLIGHYLSGDKLPYPDKIVKICDFFNSYGANINAGWLLFGDMSIMQTIPRDKLSNLSAQAVANKFKIPVLSWDETNNWTEIRDNIMRAEKNNEDTLHRKFLETTDVDLVHCFALLVKGDAMIGGVEFPPFKDGTQILIDAYIEARINDLVIAKLKETGEYIFRQYVTTDMGKHYLKAFNPQYSMIEIEGVDHIAGVVRAAQFKNYSVKFR